MHNHRKRPRRNTPHLVKALDADTGRSLGRVVDITADGLMLVTDNPVQPGARLRMRVILPVIIRDQTDVVVEAEAVWCNQDTNPNFFKAGFRFLNLSGDDGFLLEDVMHKLNLVG